MKWFLGLMLASALSAGDTVDIFGRTWSVPNRSDWKMETENGVPALRLATKRGPLAGPRRPIQFTLTATPFNELEADVMPLERSLLIAFAYRDEAHFDYAHLSIDTGAQQPVHNGIFHVYGGERVRISAEDGPPAFAASGKWYHIKLKQDAAARSVSVLVDGKPVPALQAVDRSLGPGRIGFGSFDETAVFKNVKVTSSVP